MMKNIVFITLIIASFYGNAQNKTSNNIKNLKKIENTEYLIAYSEKHSKIEFSNENFNKLLIINSNTNQVTTISLSEKENITFIKSDCKVKFLNSNFILIQTQFENEKSAKLNDLYSSNLYLIQLNTSKIHKLNSELMSVIDYEIAEENGKIIFIQKSNEKITKDLTEIITLELSTGAKTKIYSTDEK